MTNDCIKATISSQYIFVAIDFSVLIFNNVFVILNFFSPAIQNLSHFTVAVVCDNTFSDFH